MTVRALLKEAQKLPLPKRWELIDELLELGAEERPSLELTPAQAADLERRLTGKDKRIPGDQAMAMLRKRVARKK